MTTAIATTSVNATTSEADRTGYPRLGLVHRETTPVVILIMESLDRCLSLGVGVHLDKTEPLAAARVLVEDDLGAQNGPERSEPPLQFGGTCRIGQISNMQFLSHGIFLVVEPFR